MAEQVRLGAATAGAADSDTDLLLALLNTTPTEPVSGSQSDLLAEDSQARTWLQEHVANAPADTDLALLRATRTALQRVVRGEAPPSVLSDSLEQVRMRPTVGEDGVAWIRDVPAPREVAARAVLAWGWTTAAMPGRLRFCSNPECTLFLIDHSRANAARWCSMAVCGNRMKARRHYARKTDQMPVL
jgi:predicted RNA-binding Zn ribbon-like protein